MQNQNTCSDLDSLLERTPQIVLASDNARWSRFNVFLGFNSLLLISWTMIFTSQVPDKAAMCRLIALLLAVLGCALSIGWAILGAHTNALFYSFRDTLSQFEKELPENYRVQSIADKRLAKSWQSSRRHNKVYGRLITMFSRPFLTYIPVFFGVVYLCLVVVTIYEIVR
jgi:hypothetical protein